MYDIVVLIKEYGISVGLFVILVTILIPVIKWLVKWLNKMNKQIDKHSMILEDMTFNIGNIHDDCKIPTETIRSLEEKVFALQLQDETMVGELKKIEEHLKKSDENDTELKQGIKLIMNHFAIKGMGK